MITEIFFGVAITSIIIWAIIHLYFKKELEALKQNYNPDDNKSRKHQGGTRPIEVASTSNAGPTAPTTKRRLLQTTEVNVDGKDSKGNGRTSKATRFLRKFRRNKE